jgi:hypothetical protein
MRAASDLFKTNYFRMKSFLLIFTMALILSVRTYAQFEEPKLDNSDSLKVKVGADFSMQYQGLKHHADSTLIKLGMGLNLPSANLNINGYLARGIKVNLVVYLSSRHHTDTWVKGGYLLIDRLDFINSQVIDKIMDHLTIKVGVSDVDYGDEHFRRSDNGNVIHNPFVGNYVMDAFTTAPELELTYRNSGWIIMLATTSGNLDPVIASYSASTKTYSALNTSYELAYYGKVGYDKQINDALRIRLTLSGYFGEHNDHNGSLYFGDRAGSRYYLVMNKVTNNASDVDPSANHTTGNWGPGFTYKDHSIMTNLYIKLKGLEFFGTYENANGTPVSRTSNFTFNQYAGEARYLFGKQEQFYGGARYDYVKGTLSNVDSNVGRFQAALGWYMTKNIIAKLEYVNQNYSNFTAYGGNAGFKGIMVEAGISF